MGHYSHDISFQGNAHNLLNSFLEEYKRKNDIAEKQLELQREIFEFNKEQLNPSNVVSNEEVITVLKQKFNLINNNQRALFQQIDELQKSLLKTQNNLDYFIKECERKSYI